MSRMPLMIAATTPGGLLLGKENCAFWCSTRCGLECKCIGRSRAIVMANVLGENCWTHQGLKQFRKQEVRNGGQLISAGRMPGDVNSEGPQLLHQPPNL